MASNYESILSTDGGGQQWNSCIWNGSTGATLVTYKGDTAAQKGLALVGQSYLVAAIKEKSMLFVWALNKKEHAQMRMVTPGKVSALAISHDGLYCIAGIEEKLLIWQVSTGKLLRVICHHLQPISCIRFTADDSSFISAANDGQVLVWFLSSVLDTRTSHPEPEHIWAHHVLQVTDIFVSNCSVHPRVATVSSDQTCRVYDLNSGEMLISFVLEVALTSVTADAAEYHLFVGAVNGRIYQLNIYDCKPEKDIHLTEKEKEECYFSGHGKQITALSTSFDDCTLLSASYDNTARLWNIPSKQCLRVLTHKGPVLNAMFIPTPPFISATEQFRASHVINTFQRQITQNSGDPNRQMVTVEKRLKNCKITICKDDSDIAIKMRNNFIKEGSNTSESKGELKSEMNKIAQSNQQLYCYSVESVLDILRPMHK